MGCNLETVMENVQQRARKTNNVRSIQRGVEGSLCFTSALPLYKIKIMDYSEENKFINFNMLSLCKVFSVQTKQVGQVGYFPGLTEY